MTARCFRAREGGRGGSAGDRKSRDRGLRGGTRCCQGGEGPPVKLAEKMVPHGKEKG